MWNIALLLIYIVVFAPLVYFLWLRPRRKRRRMGTEAKHRLDITKGVDTRSSDGGESIVQPSFTHGDEYDGRPRANVALVTCRDCGQEVSRRALQCPKCGAPSPAGFGRLIVRRKSQLTGKIRRVSVDVDDTTYDLPNNQALDLELSPGKHQLLVGDHGFVGNDSSPHGVVFEIEAGQTIQCEVKYSQLSGLVFDMG